MTEPNLVIVESARIIFDEARRQLDRQEIVLGDVRKQTAWLFTAAGVINGVFASYSAHHHSGWHLAFMVVAITAFVATATLALIVLWPVKFTFRRDLADVIAKAQDDEPWRPIDLYVSLADQFQRYRVDNDKKIDRRYNLYATACVMLGIQVVCWAIAAI